MFIEKNLECIECGKKVKKIILEDSDTSYFLCPFCEMGDIDSDDD
jgi:DNA-directed RNA polymerase subunit RPC12/RpoP